MTLSFIWMKKASGPCGLCSMTGRFSTRSPDYIKTAAKVQYIFSCRLMIFAGSFRSFMNQILCPTPPIVERGDRHLSRFAFAAHFFEPFLFVIARLVDLRRPALRPARLVQKGALI